MKIIGHTSSGYLIEATPSELAQITGNPKDDQHLSRSRNYGYEQSHPVGTEFHVSATWDHLQKLLTNEPQRKRIAESLRAAAVLIEHTPSPLTIPATTQATE